MKGKFKVRSRANKVLRAAIAIAMLGTFVVTAGTAQAVTADSCGYTGTTSTLPAARKDIIFNEQTLTRGVFVNGAGLASQIAVFSNDESGILLGVNGTPTLFTKGGGGALNYNHASNPNLGDLTSVDTAARPFRPSLFITDKTVHPGTTQATNPGDWQNFGSPTDFISDVFGTWDTGVKSGSTLTVSKPANGNGWHLGNIFDASPFAPAVADQPPVQTSAAAADNVNTYPGLFNLNNAAYTSPANQWKDEGYGTQFRWNVSALKATENGSPVDLIPGHTYRIQVMSHDGDQNKGNGDVGEFCTNLTIPGPPTIITDAAGGTSQNNALAAISVPLGSPIADTAFLSGNAGVVTGSVAYNLFFVPVGTVLSKTEDACTSTYKVNSYSSTKTLSAGMATSDAYTTGTALGTYYWQDVYTPDGPASKFYTSATEVCGTETVTLVNARVRLNPPSATNIVSNAHTLTATVESTTDGSVWTKVPSVGLSFSIVGLSSAVFVPASGTTCTTVAALGPTLGTCTIQINDAVAEVVTVHAVATNFSVPGVTGTFTRQTGNLGCTSDSCDALKTYIVPNTQLSVTDRLTGISGNTSGAVTYLAYANLSDCNGGLNSTDLTPAINTFTSQIAPLSLPVVVGPGTSFGTSAFFTATYVGNLGTYTTPCTERASST